MLHRFRTVMLSSSAWPPASSYSFNLFFGCVIASRQGNRRQNRGVRPTKLTAMCRIQIRASLHPTRLSTSTIMISNSLPTLHCRQWGIRKQTLRLATTSLKMKTLLASKDQRLYQPNVSSLSKSSPCTDKKALAIDAHFLPLIVELFQTRQALALSKL